MNFKELSKLFMKAKLEGKDIAIELTVPGGRATEVIIVKNPNLDTKLAYYKNNYTEDLVLTRCDKIKILNAKVIKFEM